MGVSRGFDFEGLVELCLRAHEHARRSAVRAVDASLMVRSSLFGLYIVEFESGGADRRELYGKQLIAGPSGKLKAAGLKGCSPTNLRKFREFYGGYAEIRQTLPVESFGQSEIQQTLSVNSRPTSTGLRYVKTDYELPTIGILRCDDRSDAVVELTLPKEANFYASRYQSHHSSKAELVAQLESVQRELSYREGEGDE